MRTYGRQQFYAILLIKIDKARTMNLQQTGELANKPLPYNGKKSAPVHDVGEYGASQEIKRYNGKHNTFYDACTLLKMPEYERLLLCGR